MYRPLQEKLQKELQNIADAGLTKRERIICSPQSARIRTQEGKEVLNFCANNYLGLADHPALVQGAKEAMDSYGFGLASVRFICGTQDIHRSLEHEIAAFLHTEDTILYSSCFDANGGLFETLLGEEDVIISDELNHASIIDGIRLAKAQRFRYKHLDLKDLEAKLQEAEGARVKLVATDGVFSMDGDIAPLQAIVELADKYSALVMVDDSHATGFLGKTGRGSIEHCGVMGQVDIITSTLGKALGGGSGGFTTGRSEVIAILRQRSRPYLFSNTLPPAIVGAARAAFKLLSSTTARRDTLEQNTLYFRKAMTAAGFQIRPGVHPIVPLMLGDARLASTMADTMLERGIYVIGFSFPVVPRGQARIRIQISAAHTKEQLDQAVAAFIETGKELGVL
jgi:glycine C-acetyltransferase